MKKSKNTILIFLMFLLFSCKKDEVQYIFPAREVITVQGVNEHYNVVSGIDKLVVKPEIVSNKEGEFEYLWGIYKADVQLTAAVLDTIAFTKDLDYLVKEAANNWILLLRVRNKKTGYSQYFTSTLSVGTQFTRGWYVLKDQNEKADLDLFLTPSSIKGETYVENVFSKINGKQLDGRGSLLSFNTFYKSESAPGVFDNTRSLFLVSEKDASVVNVNTMKEIFPYNTLIFGGPDVKKPMVIANNFLVFYMINNGALHSMIGQGPSFGQFGGRKLKNTNNDPYYLSKFHLSYIQSLFFDEMSSSFVTSTDRSLYLMPIVETPGLPAPMFMPGNNNNQTLLFMALKARGPYTGVAIFQDKTNSSKKSIGVISAPMSPTVPIRIANTPLQTTDKIFNAENYGLIFEDENMIYFSVGKEIWTRNLSNNFEQLQFQVPADEAVSFIHHRKYNGVGTDAPYAYNYIIIGTNTSSGKYRIRMFPKTSGNLSAQPAFTLEGNGNAKDVIYISPAISSSATSFPDTF